MRKYISQSSKGFTLIELLVVIAIIGILSSVVLGNLRSATVSARDAKRRVESKEVMSAVNMYYSDYGQYPPISDDDYYGGWDSSQDGYFIQNLIDAGYISNMPQDPMHSSTGRSYFYGNEVGADVAGCPGDAKAVIKHYPEGNIKSGYHVCFSVAECTCMY